MSAQSSCILKSRGQGTSGKHGENGNFQPEIKRVSVDADELRRTGVAPVDGRLKFLTFRDDEQVPVGTIFFPGTRR